MSKRITGLPPVNYGHCREIMKALDIRQLTGSPIGVRFIDLKEYNALNILGRKASSKEGDDIGGVLVNPLKTKKSDPENVYVAISPRIGDGILLHQLAHVLDYLGGSKLMPGVSRPLSFEAGIPSEQLEHPHEFGYWLDYLQKKFRVQLDADDTIILYLYQNEMLIKGEEIEKQDLFVLRTKSEGILKFLGERSAEIDELIRELPGYIGSRVGVK